MTENTIDTSKSFFSPLGNTKPYFKVALQGEAGSGKTYTASLIAKGLHKKLGSTKPIIFFDTERASKFLAPMFKESGVEVLVKESRSLADLKEVMRLMRSGTSDILIIDSISHIWENFIESYKNKNPNKIKTSLTMYDWGVIKPAWRAEFSDPFVNDLFHIIMCGRVKDIFSNEVSEETGKRELFVSGKKMSVEKETAYEPDLILQMDRLQEMENGMIKSVTRQAFVVKDRADIIDGKTFENPTFATVEPVVDALLKDPQLKSTVAERDASELIKTEEEKREWRSRKDIALEEIEGYLVSLWPSSGAGDKKMKLDALNNAFGTMSWKAVEIMTLDRIEQGLGAIKQYGENYVNAKKAELEAEKNPVPQVSVAEEPKKELKKIKTK